MEDDNEQKELELTDWKNAPTVSDLKADFDEAQSAHGDHVTNVENWIANLEGKQTFTVKKGRSKIVPKLIRKQAEWRYASLSEPFLSTEELFNAAPVTFEDKQAAYQNGLVLNYQFNHKLNKTKFIDEYVRTAVDEGTVIVKVSWESEEDGNGNSIVNKPLLDICPYNNTVIDPTCEGDIDKAEFVVYSFETSLSDLKKDGRYSNLGSITKGNASVLATPDYETQDSSNFSFKDEARKKFVVNEYWGFWDINGDGITVPILAVWAGDTLIRLEESPMPDGKLPFILVQYLPVRKSNYGQPDGYLLEDNQKVIGAVTRGMIDTIGRSANGQMGVRKDALDVVNSRKFERGSDFKFNANVDPKQAFHMETFPEIPRSALEMMNIQNNEAESLTGVKAFSGGITGNALGDNVGGIRSALDATAKRELGILRRLANGVNQIGRKIISMNKEFLSDEEVIRITNEEFVSIRREDLGGEFDIRLTISTPEADADKSNKLSFMHQTIGNSMPIEMSQIILADIARLDKMPELAKRIEDFKPQPDPATQRKAELEIALLEAQVYNEQAKGQENAVDVELKQAKTEEVMAKTRDIHSTADQKDLDFVENEAGTKREHEMNMKEFEQEMQNNGKIVDAMVNDEQSAGATKAPR